MRFLSLSLFNFRNHAESHLDVSARRVVFHGLNGEGKTNLLEALYLLSNGKSFRTTRLNQLIRWGSEITRITARVSTASGQESSLAVALQGARRLYSRDGREFAGPRHFVGAVDTFLLLPQDIDLIDGLPARRRDAVDRAIFQLSPAYLDTYQRYQQALQQRNALLKAYPAPPDEHFLPWEQVMATAGAEMLLRRSEYTQALNSAMSTIRDGLASFAEPLHITYKGNPALPEGDERPSSTHLMEVLAVALSRSRQRDRELGHTTVGPHRDEFEMLISGAPAREHASLGQRRSFSLAFLLGGIHLYVERRHTLPVLLLDDLELDAQRCRAVMAYIDEHFPEMQVAVTTIEPERFRFSAQDTQLYEVRQGTVRG